MFAGASRIFLLVVVCSLISTIAIAQQPPPDKLRQRLAQVGDQAVFEDDVLPMVEGQLQQLRAQEYDLKKKALDILIDRRLLEAEARKQGIAPQELLDREADSKAPEPTEDEVNAFYTEQKDRLNRPLKDVKTQIQQYLKKQKIEDLRDAYYERLRQKGDFTVFLRPPRVNVTVDPARVRGNPNAPVTIVEFSDFQCPFCLSAYPTMKQLLTKYEGRVRLAYRDFPLQEIHDDAENAAEAARCAGDQGMFWEYHDRLFETRKLDGPSLINHAEKLSLDMKRFEDCVKSGEHRAHVQEDLRAGVNAGMSGTPGFFINGVFVSGAQPIGVFEKAIDAELASLKATASRQGDSTPAQNGH